MSYENSVSSNDLDLAKEIFERFVGYKVFPRIVCEDVHYGPAGAELTHVPVIKLISVQGRARHIHDFFGHTDWIDIPLSEAILHQKDGRAAVTLPPTLFGTPYVEARVTYEAGLTVIPDDIKEAVKTIIDGVRAGEIDRVNCLLPVEVLEVISRYRKGA